MLTAAGRRCPGAYVLARYEFPGRRVVRALVTVPFVLPTVVVGSAFLALLGAGGPLGASGSTRPLGAILLAHVFFNYAVVVRTVGGLWSHLDPRQEEAARMLGASRLRAFREVTLPALRPAIAAAAAIVFLFTFTSFGVILILGGPGTVDARDRDLPPDRAAPRPAARRRADDRAARRRDRAAARAHGRIEGRQRATLSAPRRGRDRAPAAHRAARARSSPPTSR